MCHQTLTIEDILQIAREDVRREETLRRSMIAKEVWKRKKAAGWKPAPKRKTP